MKKVLILEDHKTTREILEEIVRKVDSAAVIFSLETAEEAYAVAMQNAIDMFILDIILKPGQHERDKSGAEFAQNIRMVSRYHFTPIIFLTALYDEQLTMYSSIHCYRFIEKPCDYDELEEVIRDAIQFRTENAKDRCLYYRVGGVIYSIEIRNIIYAQSKRHDLRIVTTEDEVTVPYKTCKALLKELDSEDFLQCSRGTVVNKNFVKKIDAVNRYIYLKGRREILEIGVVLKNGFLEHFTGPDPV